jgi:hypothetical protein
MALRHLTNNTRLNYVPCYSLITLLFSHLSSFDYCKKYNWAYMHANGIAHVLSRLQMVLILSFHTL